LIWGLAAELGPEYGIPDKEIKRNFTIAELKLAELLSYDVENADVQFVMGEER